MSQSSTFQELAATVAASVGDTTGDLQRYVVAPSMLEMIGPVTGKSILDLFCGAGYLSRRLCALGADITAVDGSERLIGIAREINKLEDCDIKYAVAEPTDLSVIEDSTFDDIVCNMGLMVSRDLAGTVAELARMVKLGGRFIFSVMHPCFNMPDACWVRDDNGRYLYKTVDHYYTERWSTSDPAAVVRSHAKIKHRTLSRYVNALSARGFNVRRVFEPRPSPDIITLKPDLEIYDRVPSVLIVEAIFPYL